VTPFLHPAHRTGHADLPHPALGQELTLSRATLSVVSDPFVWTGRALQTECEKMEGVGLAYLYPALAWRVCAPGHHEYPRAPDLILGKAVRVSFGLQY
jgi:hypothetical protein